MDVNRGKANMNGMQRLVLCVEKTYWTTCNFIDVCSNFQEVFSYAVYAEVWTILCIL